MPSIKGKKHWFKTLGIQLLGNSLKVESKGKSLKELENLALTLKDRCLIDERIDVQRLRIALKGVHGIDVSQNRAYALKAALEVHSEIMYGAAMGNLRRKPSPNTERNPVLRSWRSSYRIIGSIVTG